MENVQVFLIHWSHALILIACVFTVWSNHCTSKRVKELYEYMQTLKETGYAAKL